jgi:DNA-binding transcriptional MocR family regulator
VAVVRQWLGGALIATPDGGYYLGVRVRAEAGEPGLLAAARAEGIVLSRGSAFHPPGEPPRYGTHFLRLPFHTMPEADFAYGVERLSRVCAQISGSEC